MAEILRNKDGKVIGKLVESGGVTKLYNSSGKFLGSYDSSANTTYDAAGAVVAKCNLLVSLLKN
jgi:hypothetical protein